jgi:proline racemase
MQANILDEWNKKNSWKAPDNWQRINTIEAHTEGEPLRIITSGYPEPIGKTILEKRAFSKKNHDHLRKALMWEPRGHADMYGCILTPPVTETADFGILFIHNEGFSSMCGHGILGITQVALETGMIEAKSPITKINIDTPAGLVTAYGEIKDNSVQKVYFDNVACFVEELDATVDVPGLGKVKYDLAFGGAYYAYVDAQSVSLKLLPENAREIISKGMDIKNAVMQSRKPKHPFENDLNFLYGVIFIDKPESESAHSRNVCIFAEGEVDRSPTGTGVSGRVAIHHARGEIGLKQPIIIESIIGSRFTATVVDKVSFGPYDAVIPRVEGRAFITGQNSFYINPDDPLKEGFLIR